MTRERFSRIEQVFQEAMDQPPADRSAFLATTCADDAELLAEVRALIESQDEAESQLAEVVGSAAAALDREWPAADIGRNLGPYVLVRELGRGGMGVVYHGVRVDGEFIQSVAIKLVKRGMDTEDILRRFRAERQILATLSHPNICGLLDGGTSPDGRPYFVMEYIEGKPLVSYCLERRLPIEERLRLFEAVCAAVEHAHQHKVVHRDLKPGNILVTADGTAKLLDFGIAKLLAPELIPGGLPPTRASDRVLTPEYTSPEQIRGEGITAASDVYSLGVILFELITGQRPYAATGRTTMELERAICEDPPPRASRFSDVPVAPALDGIAEKAMRKDPAERFQSAAELREHIGRFLRGESLDPPEPAPRRGSGGRSGPGWLVSILALASILAASGTAAWWLRESARGQELPDDPAVLRKYLRASDLMRRNPVQTDWPIGIPPHFAEAIRLLEDVTAASARFGRGWALLADAYNVSSEFDPKLRHVLQRRAWRAASQAVAVDPESGNGYAILGELALYRDWDLPAAERLLKTALNLNPALEISRREYADVLRITGRPDQARAEIERALLMNPSVARLHTQRALLLYDTGRCEEAIESADRALRLRPNQTEPLWVKGLCRERQGQLEAARAFYAQALQLAPLDGRALPAMGHLYGLMGRRDDALRLVAELQRQRRRGRVVDYSVALVLAGIGDKAGALGALERAWELRDASMLYAGVEYRFRGLRAEPEFQQLLRRLRLRR